MHQLTVMTYNLLSPGHADWSRRREVVRAALRDLQPDVVALQECARTRNYDQATDLLGEEYETVWLQPRARTPSRRRSHSDRASPGRPRPPRHRARRLRRHPGLGQPAVLDPGASPATASASPTGTPGKPRTAPSPATPSPPGTRWCEPGRWSWTSAGGSTTSSFAAAPTAPLSTSADANGSSTSRWTARGPATTSACSPASSYPTTDPAHG